MAVKIQGTVVIDDSRNVVNVVNVDGRDVSADGSKLDTVESNADVTDGTNVGADVEGSLVGKSVHFVGDGEGKNVGGCVGMLHPMCSTSCPAKTSRFPAL